MAEGSGLRIRARKRVSETFTLDVEFHAPAGITMLFGPSGAGKTTTLDCIAGLARPDEGRIEASGRELFDAARRVNVPPGRRGIGYVFQDLALFPHLTVEENAGYGVRGSSTEERRGRVGELLRAFRIEHLSKRRPREISGGERQRAALARSLATEPSALLLDEPLAGLDRMAKGKILEDLRGWNAARRIPILYVTHATGEVFALGERVVVLEAGRVAAEGAPAAVLDNPSYEGLTQLEWFENQFDADVAAVDAGRGTMTCRLEGTGVELEAPLVRQARGGGARVRIAIRAGDILLATEAPRGLSARNVIEGRLTGLETRAATVLARVKAGRDDTGGAVQFEAHITAHAAESLLIKLGQPVWCVIKAHSCHIVPTA